MHVSGHCSGKCACNKAASLSLQDTLTNSDHLKSPEESQGQLLTSQDAQCADWNAGVFRLRGDFTS
jgi:hypothetical protein